MRISTYVVIPMKKWKPFKYLGSLLTNQIHKEIKCRFKAGGSCYYSVKTFLSSRLLSKNLKIKIYKTIILSVVLYGCDTWFLTLREERRLRIFENRALRRIFGPKSDENGEWRRFHNEELRNLYRSHSIVRVTKSRRLRWAGHVARMEEGRRAFNISLNLQERNH